MILSCHVYLPVSLLELATHTDELLRGYLTVRQSMVHHECVAMDFHSAQAGVPKEGDQMQNLIKGEIIPTRESPVMLSQVLGAAFFDDTTQEMLSFHSSFKTLAWSTQATRPSRSRFHAHEHHLLPVC